MAQEVKAGGAPAVPALTLALDAIADTLDLAAVGLVATPTGGTAPYTYAWTVDEATTGIADATDPTTTYTPTTGGRHAAVCTVTDADGATAVATWEWVVGDSEGYVYWILDFSDPDIDGWDFFDDGNLTYNGVTVEPAGGSLTAAGQLHITGGKLVSSLAAPNARGLAFSPANVATLFGGGIPVDCKFGVAVDADITADNDGVFCQCDSLATAVWFNEARRSGGTQRVLATQAATTQTDVVAAQARQVVTRQFASAGFQTQYSLVAWDGTPPLNSEMSVVDPPVGGVCGYNALKPGQTAIYDLATVWYYFVPRGNNGRVYHFPAVWWAVRGGRV